MEEANAMTEPPLEAGKDSAIHPGSSQQRHRKNLGF